jgi:sugar phosphate isomerase/epimerase/cytochrome c2
MSQRLLAVLTMLVIVVSSRWPLIAAEPDSTGLFARKNLVAWCIVPFDSKKRGPEERAAMLEKLGFTHFAYDYRAEHIPTFDAEIEALKRHHVELSAWWFPGSLNDEAKMTLAVFAKHKVTPQLWVTGGGGPAKDEADQRARVVAEAARIRPIAEAAAAVGCKVALYNHGGWFGEPENQIAIIQELKLDNVGIVYNLHHGHDHLSRFPELLQKMKPYLYTLNLNGMVNDGERKGQKILQLSEGDLDLKLLKTIRDSGYAGPIGILGHTQDDAEERLQDNLDGLDWLLPQLNGQPAGPKPKMRTPVPRATAAIPAAAANKPLVDGKFGQALDGRAGGAFIAGRDEFHQFPITVECWTKLTDKSSYNILVANELKSSGTHWELFSMAGTGNLTAYVPGFAPDHCNSNAMICDGQWHHVAMIVEPARIRLYLDGKQVADQLHKRTDKATEPGGLALASLVDRVIGCSGLIDEVRISKGVRQIISIPDKPFAVDESTIALWHLDELVEQKRFEDAGPKKSPAVLGQADAVKPTPAKGASQSSKIQGHWGEDAVGFRWTEADSRDDRFGQVDFGTFFSGSITGAGGPVYKGIVVRIGDQREASVCYDTELLRVAAGWNGFLKFDPARFGIIVPPRVDGEPTFTTQRFPGVSLQEQFANFREANPYGPLPKDVAHYEGLYRHGSRVVLKYTVGVNGESRDSSATTILESPWIESRNGIAAITRTMLVSPSAVPIRVLIAEAAATVRLSSGSAGGSIVMQPGLGRVLLIAPHDTPVVLKVLIASAGTNEAAFDELAAASPVPEELLPLTEAGPLRWGQPLVTTGDVASAQMTEPYVVDTITLPFDNPYRALFFCGGHDFLSDGRAAVCTLHGDVWLVGGIDDSLKKVTWQRFATGLFQPLGLKVVKDEIYVVGRDQITRLRDLNNDGEADVYENFNNDAHVTLNGHEYVTCLETDRAGNFYYVKGNCNSQTPHDGSLLRVSTDGSKLDVFATGFRNPNGIGMGPKDEITVAPQEGEWTPASGVFLVREGGFYGGMMSHHRAVPPTDFERPLVWFPRLADNSSGGQVWTTSSRWGPLSNHLLHMSYGQCRLRLILRDSGQLPELALNNGASIELPLRFTSGIHRGRMNPHDGQLYVTGLKGWTTSAVHDGCFQRVRYTGKSLRMPIGLETYQNGVALRFSSPLDRNAAQDTANYQLEAWNYKWSAAYGSPEYRPSAPGQTGRDEVEVRSATLLDKQTVFLELANLRPVDQLAISYTLLSTDNQELDQSAILTLNSISKDVFSEKELYRKPEDLEQAQLVASLVPGVHVAERLADRGAETQVLNIRGAQRMISWDRPALRGSSALGKIEARGWIKIPRTGRYRFYGEDSARPSLDRKGPRAKPASTDSARVINPSSTFLSIGNNSADEVPVDGLELSLSRGVHPISVEYLAMTDKDVHYRLLWESSRFPREAIPASVLFREPITDPVPSQRQSGAMLFEKLRCANCHETPAPHETPKHQPGSDQGFVEIFRSTPRLDGVGSRLQPTWIAHWLRQPQRLRSDTKMPALLGPNDHGTANDIAAYLSTLGKETSESVPSALAQTEAETLFRTGAELYEQLGCIACHSTADPNQPDEWHRVSLHYVNSKFQRHSLIEYLRDPHRHHPNSPMPNFRLTETEVMALAEYLRREARGQLEVPQGEPGNVERGRLAFEKHRCANCHSIETAGTLAKANVAAIQWRGEQKSGAMGCLESTLKDSPKSPRFHLTETDRSAIGQFLGSRTDAKLAVARTRSVDLWLGELRCLACHSRDSRQSPWPEIIAEEGSGKAAESIPPLTWAGEKLQGPWIEKLLQGEVKQKPRPWVKARMPAFPAYASLIAHGMAAEHGVLFDEVIPSKLNPAHVDLGRRLTMREGLDCRQCHGVGSEQPRGDASTQIALGINFAMTRDRLRPEFALRQMLDPSRYDIGSRMPRFAPDLKTTAAKQIEGGDARKQFELLKEFIWSIKDE